MGPQPAQAPPRCTKCNSLSVYPSTASVPISVLLLLNPLFIGFNLSIKGLTVSGYLNLLSFISSTDDFSAELRAKTQFIV